MIDCLGLGLVMMLVLDRLGLGLVMMLLLDSDLVRLEDDQVRAQARPGAT